MTPWRRAGYKLAVYLGWCLVELLWRTARIRVVGEEHLQAMITEHGAVVPVCWHQHLLICARYVAARRIPGLKVGYLISPSLDGEAPTMLAKMYGAEVIRGSGTYTGTQAVRQLYKYVKSDHLSPLITPDGPRGPRFEFKGGALTIAQLCGVPVVPLAFAARPAKVLRTWDKFVLPPPFARIVVAVGEPIVPPRKTTPEAAAALQVEMSKRMHATFLTARAALNDHAS